MFQLNSHKPLITDLPEIKFNYQELLADENPILLTGTNAYGNRILGVIVGESYNEFFIRYFHVIITEKCYVDFINREITLLQILKQSDIIFALDYIDNIRQSSNILRFDEIPTEYLPLENSYCPDNKFLATFNYGVSLQGKTSDLHIVDVAEANEIQTSFEQVMYNAINTLGELNLKPKCYLEPAMTGSFRVNYQLKFDNLETEIQEKDHELVADYLKSYINFLVTSLQNESETSLLDDQEVRSESFEDLAKKLHNVFKAANFFKTSEDVENELSMSLTNGAIKFEKISAQIKNSSSFSNIEVLNYLHSGDDQTLGMVDQDYYEKVKSKLSKRILDKRIKVTQEELDFKPYRIWVYNLNTETRSGSARLYNQTGEEFTKISIKILNKEIPVDNSIYSKSLDEQKVIEIQGRARKVNGVIKTILGKL